MWLRVQSLSRVQLYVTSWAVACQAQTFFHRIFWARILEWDLLDAGIEPASLASTALAGRFFTTVPPRKPRRQFAGVIKLRILTWGDCTGLFVWAQCNHKGPHKSEAGDQRSRARCVYGIKRLG